MSEERQEQVQEEQQVQEGREPEPLQSPAQPELPLPEPERDWRDRRIGEQSARLRERNARIAELEAQLNQYRAPQGSQGQNGPQGQQQYGAPQGPQAPQMPPGDLQRQINEAAARMAEQQEFTRRCNDVAEQGKSVYQDFDRRVQRLTGLVDANDQQQVQMYNAFLNAVMETGQAPRLIYELGGDLNEASRIMAMNPVRMAVELTKLSIRPGVGAETSGAPRPLIPVATQGQSNRVPIAPDDPERADVLNIDEWMTRRLEQVASRRQKTLG